MSVRRLQIPEIFACGASRICYQIYTMVQTKKTSAERNGLIQSASGAKFLKDFAPRKRAISKPPSLSRARIPLTNRVYREGFQLGIALIMVLYESQNSIIIIIMVASKCNWHSNNYWAKRFFRRWAPGKPDVRSFVRSSVRAENNGFFVESI